MKALLASSISLLPAGIPADLQDSIYQVLTAVASYIFLQLIERLKKKLSKPKAE